jgi:hypothetical protein
MTAISSLKEEGREMRNLRERRDQEKSREEKRREEKRREEKRREETKILFSTFNSFLTTQCVGRRNRDFLKGLKSNSLILGE